MEYPKKIMSRSELMKIYCRRYTEDYSRIT